MYFKIKTDQRIIKLGLSLVETKHLNWLVIQGIQTLDVLNFL